MKRSRKIALSLVTAALLSLISLSLLALPTGAGSFPSGQDSFGFDSPDPFTSSDTGNDFSSPGRDFTPLPDKAKSGQDYFIHDQLLKLIVLLTFTAAASIIIIKSRYKYRKLLLLASVIVLGFYLGGFLCPLTAVQNLFLKWQNGYLILFLGGLVVPALLWGRIFCGYVCPFGAIQELLHLKRIRREIPRRWSRYLQLIKYGVLGYLVVRVLTTGQIILLDYTPFKALFTWGGLPLSIAITVILAALSLIMYRPFCRYFCPLGAFLGILSRFSPLRIRVNSNCVSCGLCEKACPTGAIAGKPATVQSSECLLCGECLKKCPKKAIAPGSLAHVIISLPFLVQYLRKPSSCH